MTPAHQRNPAIDIMKGIAILLMMYEHLCSSPSAWAISFIYSFHMPLFFILAGIFIPRNQEFVPFVKKSTIRLIVPLLVSMAIIAIIRAFQSYPEFSLRDVIHLGPLWFLWALFLARLSFYLLVRIFGQQSYSNIIIGVLCFLVSISSVILGKLKLTPYSPALGLSSLVFIYVGWIMKEYYKQPGRSIPNWLLGIAIVIWFLAIIYGGIDMRGLYYKQYALSVIGACCASFILFKASQLICRPFGGEGQNHKISSVVWPRITGNIVYALY